MLTKKLFFCKYLFKKEEIFLRKKKKHKKSKIKTMNEILSTMLGCVGSTVLNKAKVFFVYKGKERILAPLSSF